MNIDALQIREMDNMDLSHANAPPSQPHKTIFPHLDIPVLYFCLLANWHQPFLHDA